MAKICPVCKKHRMYLGGFVIKNSTICGKCYDRLASRNLTYYNKNLEIEDIWYIFENTEENQDIRETVQKILNKKTRTRWCVSLFCFFFLYLFIRVRFHRI